VNEAPSAYSLFCLSKGPGRSDQPTKFKALGLMRSALDIADVMIVRTRSGHGWATDLEACS